MTPEEQIHCAIADYLRLNAKKSVWFHPANGGKRNIVEARKLKRMGVLPGVSDFIGLKDTLPWALELKTPEGRPTDYQLAFIDAWKREDGVASIAYGFDQAVSTLKSWGIV